VAFKTFLRIPSEWKGLITVRNQECWFSKDLYQCVSGQDAVQPHTGVSNEVKEARHRKTSIAQLHLICGIKNSRVNRIRELE
jgi:hypothetical protein